MSDYTNDDVDVFLDTISEWCDEHLRDFVADLLMHHPHIIEFIDINTGEMK